jgi:hypothetical protein
MILPDLVRSLRPKIIASGLVTEHDLDMAARAHIRGPRNRDGADAVRHRLRQKA